MTIMDLRLEKKSSNKIFTKVHTTMRILVIALALAAAIALIGLFVAFLGRDLFLGYGMLIAFASAFTMNDMFRPNPIGHNGDKALARDIIVSCCAYFPLATPPILIGIVWLFDGELKPNLNALWLSAPVAAGLALSAFHNLAQNKRAPDWLKTELASPIVWASMCGLSCVITTATALLVLY